MMTRERIKQIIEKYGKVKINELAHQCEQKLMVEVDTWPILWQDHDKQWKAFGLGESDEDIPINYCPFCGVELKILECILNNKPAEQSTAEIK